MQTIYVAVGVIIYQQKVLIAKRQKHQHQGGLWEFPGGKIETNENTQQALLRELKEEINLDLKAEQLHKMMQIPHTYEDKKVHLSVAWANIDDTQYKMITSNEEQPIKWVAVDELAQYAFPQANRAIVLRLPVLLTNL